METFEERQKRLEGKMNFAGHVVTNVWLNIGAAPITEDGSGVAVWNKRYDYEHLYTQVVNISESDDPNILNTLLGLIEDYEASWDCIDQCVAALTTLEKDDWVQYKIRITQLNESFEEVQELKKQLDAYPGYVGF